MKTKRIFSLLLALLTLTGSLSMTATAAEAEQQELELAFARATGQFDMEVPANTLASASTSFPLEAGETVTIKASYTPFSASVDFGLISPDGYFHYINVTGGSFDRTIEVEERGNYTFAIQNNSSRTIRVSGYVNY